MTLPAELETSVTQLRAKHTALVTAVNNYLSGTVSSSKQDLLDMAASLHDRIEVEEHTLLGQVARKAGLHPRVLSFMRHGPLSLFMNGEQGAWYDPSDLSTLFQDAAGTIPVTADGDPVGLMLDKSGGGHHISQSISTKRPTYQTNGVLHWLMPDKVDDFMVTPTSVAFSGSQKAFFSSALRKTDGTSRETLFETSSSVGANSGVFGVSAPETATYGVATLMNGGSGQALSLLLPEELHDFVHTAEIDMGAISAARSSQEVNGVAFENRPTGISTTAAMTDQPIYLFARGGTATFFGGRFYGLVIRSGSISTEVRALMTRYHATKAGVTI